MVLKHWTLFVLMIHALWPGIYGYRTMYITQPKNGFYCRDGHLQNITDADQQQCTRNCLINQACRVMSYNQKDHLCVLGEFASDVAVRHPEYMLMVFRSEITDIASYGSPNQAHFIAAQSTLATWHTRTQKHCVASRPGLTFSLAMAELIIFHIFLSVPLGVNTTVWGHLF